MENNTLNPGERYFQELRTATFRKEKFEYVHTGIIDADGEMWTTTTLDEANIFQVYNQYREKHGIPFPDEIAELRRHYGLSAAKMSQILGFGVNQYRMYEDGEVPSLSNARAIIAAREKDLFLQFLEATKAEMSQGEYARIKSKVEGVTGEFKPACKPTMMTGYRSLSLAKTSAVVGRIIAQLGPTFITKMNKLLFYIDFSHYKNHGYGITGLSYRALPFGPVPDEWAKVYSALEGIELEEFVYPGGHSGIQLTCEKTIDNDDLDQSESETIQRVCALLGDMNAGEISEISHKEKAWRDNMHNRGEISYQEAFALNVF